MEPWLSGAHSHLSPIPRLLCCSLDLSLADVRHWTAPLLDQQLWDPQGPAGTVGFQLRHLAGSVDRLTTYARGHALSPAQLQFLKDEAVPGATKQELLTALEHTYAQTAEWVQMANGFDQPCYIGRQKMETPLGVLLAHIAEHTQRHTGQLIVLCKLAAAGRRDV